MTQYQYSSVCNKYPMTLEVEMIRGCNVWPPCPMCTLTAITQDKGRPMKTLDVGTLETNKDLFLNSHYSFFCGLGEILLSRTFFYYLENFDPKSPISFFSNGQLLTKEHVEKMIHHNIRDIGFSIDAGTEETYRKIRGHKDYTLAGTLENVHYLTRRFNEMRKETNIMLLFVLMKVNYRELPQFIENGIRIGIRHFKTWHMRRGLDGHDYRDHVRNGFHFRYSEQSILENAEVYEDFKVVRDECYDIAEKNGVTFETEYTRENEYYQ